MLFSIHAHGFVPCEYNTKDDKGLQTLVEVVYNGNSNTLQMERLTGLPETPVKAPPARVDLLKWCRCVYSTKAEKFGESMAISMSVLDPKKTRLYDEWLKKLPPKQAGVHAATCYNSSSLSLTVPSQQGSKGARSYMKMACTLYFPRHQASW